MDLDMDTSYSRDPGVASISPSRAPSPEGKLDPEMVAEQHQPMIRGFDSEYGLLSKPVDIPPRETKGIKWVMVVLGIYSSIFLFALDNTVVSDVQPRLATEFPDGMNKLACKFGQSSIPFHGMRG
jgi:hypothetical protein